MSFLRIKRGVMGGKELVRETVVYGGCKFTVENYKPCKAKFVTRKKAGIYVYRSKNGFCESSKPTDFDQRTVSQPSAHDPRHVEKRDSGICRRVYRHGLLWRVTVGDIWKSDHATCEDALAGINPIGVEPGTIEKGIIVVPK